MVPVTQATGKVLSPAAPDIHPASGQDVRATAQSGDVRQEQEQVRLVTEQEVQEAVWQANAELAGVNERIGFGYDKRLNQLFVRVVDRISGETVREIPPREFIEHQAAMKEMVGLILDKRA